MVFAACAGNVRYLSAPWHTLSWLNITCGGSSPRHIVYQSPLNRIQGRASFAKSVPICGFLRHFCVFTIDLQLLRNINPGICLSRHPVGCRGPPSIRVSPKL